MPVPPEAGYGFPIGLTIIARIMGQWLSERLPSPSSLDGLSCDPCK
jgi:hypothetical protein